MEVSRWAVENWFDILNAIGIISGLFFTAHSLRSETKTRKVANLLAMTANHREIWKETFTRPDLAEVVNPSADVVKQPVTYDQEIFVKMVILQLSSVYEALKNELVIQQEGLRRDAASFLSLPIPGAVWEKIKVFQNADFAAFIENCRRGPLS